MEDKDTEKTNDTTYVSDDDAQSENAQNQYNDIISLKESNKHEEEMQKLENDKLLNLQSIEIGWIGKVFGGDKNASRNITAVINILLLIGAVGVSLIIYYKEQDTRFVGEIWSVIVPVITLSLGYLFGKK